MYATIYDKLKTYAENQKLKAADIESLTSQQIRSLIQGSGISDDICEAVVSNIRRQLKKRLEKNEADMAIQNVINSIAADFPNATGEYEGDGIIILRLKG
ncbi:MAG TPA: hypothetical protein ENH94_07415 [Phycisphaerales bacterium]|nr:hypothetical protein [Phycisphaerales bacterium]